MMQAILKEDGDFYTLEEWEDRFGYNPMNVDEIYHDDPAAGDANVVGRLYSVREGNDDGSDWTVEQGWCLVNILHRFIISEEIERMHHQQ